MFKAVKEGLENTFAGRGNTRQPALNVPILAVAILGRMQGKYMWLRNQSEVSNSRAGVSRRQRTV